MSTALRATLALIFTILAWGISPALVRSFTLVTGPADSIVIRMLFTAICSLPVFFFTGVHIERSDIGKLLFVSIIGMFGYFICSIFGFAIVPAGIGSMIFATQPLLIALVAAVIGTERLTLATTIGLVISFAGSIYLFSGDSASTKSTDNLLIGGLLIFASCIAFSLYVIYSKPLIQKYGPMKITAWSLVLCAPVALPFFSGSTLATLQALNMNAIASLLFLSIAATVCAVITWNYAVGKLNSSTVGATLYIIPVLASLAGWFLLGEKIGASTLIAGVIILAGVAFAEVGKSLNLKGHAAAIAAVLFAVTMWGMIPVAMRYLVLNLSPESAMVLRLYPAALLSVAVLIWLGVKPIAWRDWGRILIAALLGNVGYQVCAAYGMQSVPASWTGMLFGLEPVFIALMAVALAGERLTFGLVAGITVALIGTIILLWGGTHDPASNVSAIGLMLVTLSTMGWGIYTVLIRPVSQKYGSIQVACIAMAIAGLPMVFFVRPELPQLISTMSGMSWIALGFVVVFGTFLSTAAWNYSLGRLQSSTAGIFLYVQPVVAAIGGVFILGEQITWPLLAGGAMIILGVAIAQFAPRLASKNQLETAT